MTYYKHTTLSQNQVEKNMTTDIWTENELQNLSDADLKEFQEIVLRDVKNKLTNIEEKTILNNNLDLWLYSLQVIRREIELQLTQYKTNLKLKVLEAKSNGSSQEEIDSLMINEQSWRNNAMKFLMAVERKTLYVKLLVEEDDLLTEKD